MEERECNKKSCRNSIIFPVNRSPEQDWIQVVCTSCKALNHISLIRVEEEVKQVELR